MDISTPNGMKAAIDWQRRHLSVLGEGGTWLIPRSGTIIRVSHANKTLTVVAAFLPEPDTRKVTEAMGWTYDDKVFGNPKTDNDETTLTE